MLAIVLDFLTCFPRPIALLTSLYSFDSSDVKVPVPRLNSLSVAVVAVPSFLKSRFCFPGRAGDVGDLV